MKTEFEISFPNVSHNNLREKIKELWGELKKEKTLMKRVVFKKEWEELKKAYFRVRDEWDKISCSYKSLSDWDLDIHSVKELETQVEDFDTMKHILELTGLKQTAYQETYREVWSIHNEIECMLDQWPWLSPFVEIEWENEDVVRKYTKLLWFKYEDWIFGAVDELYYRELWIPHNITNSTPEITFKKPLRA